MCGESRRAHCRCLVSVRRFSQRHVGLFLGTYVRMFGLWTQRAEVSQPSAQARVADANPETNAQHGTHRPDPRATPGHGWAFEVRALGTRPAGQDIHLSRGQPPRQVCGVQGHSLGCTYGTCRAPHTHVLLCRPAPAQGHSGDSAASRDHDPSIGWHRCFPQGPSRAHRPALGQNLRSDQIPSSAHQGQELGQRSWQGQRNADVAGEGLNRGRAGRAEQLATGLYLASPSR